MVHTKRKNAYFEQIAFMIGLLVLLALCIAALLFFKKQSASDPLSQTRVDASADIEAALERLTQD